MPRSNFLVLNLLTVLAALTLAGCFKGARPPSQSESVNPPTKVEIKQDMAAQADSSPSGEALRAGPISAGATRLINSHGMNRETRVVLSTTLVSAVTGKAITSPRDVTISALVPGKPDIVWHTDSQGHLLWEDGIPTNVYKKRRYQTYTIRITDHLTQTTTTRTVVINPWQPQSASFLIDVDSIGSATGFSGEILSQPHSDEPRFKTEKICLSRQGLDYKIDNDLNLTYVASYKLSLAGLILNLDNLDMGKSAPPTNLYPGRYLLSMAVYRAADIPRKGSLESVHPAVAYQRVIELEGGSPIMDVELPINQLSLALLRNYLVVQITPLSDELQSDKIALSDIDPATAKVETDLGVTFTPAVTAFTPKDDCFTITPPRMTKDARAAVLNQHLAKVSVHELARTTQVKMVEAKSDEEEATGWVNQAQAFGIKPHLVEGPVDVMELTQDNTISGDDLKSALACWDQHSWSDDAQHAKCLNNAKNLAVGQKLCKLIQFNDEKDGKDCVKKTEDVLRVEDRTFVYRLAAAEFVDGASYSFSAGTSFTLGKASFTDIGNMKINTMTIVGNGNLGMSANLGKPEGKNEIENKKKLFGFSTGLALDGSIGKNFWAVTSSSERNIEDTGFTFAPTMPLNVERKNFALTLSRWRQCYVVRARKPIVSDAHMVCFAPSEGERKMAESYFDIFTPETSLVTIDQGRETSRILLPIRSERDYYAFIHELLQKAPPFKRNDTPIDISVIVRRAIDRVSDKLPIQAGVVSTQVAPQDMFERVEAKVKKLSVLPNAFQDFGIVRVHDVNDPLLHQGLTTRE